MCCIITTVYPYRATWCAKLAWFLLRVILRGVAIPLQFAVILLPYLMGFGFVLDSEPSVERLADAATR